MSTQEKSGNINIQGLKPIEIHCPHAFLFCVEIIKTVWIVVPICCAWNVGRFFSSAADVYVKVACVICQKEMDARIFGFKIETCFHIMVTGSFVWTARMFYFQTGTFIPKKIKAVTFIIDFVSFVF